MRTKATATQNSASCSTALTLQRGSDRAVDGLIVRRDAGEALNNRGRRFGGDGLDVAHRLLTHCSDGLFGLGQFGGEADLKRFALRLGLRGKRVARFRTARLRPGTGRGKLG